MQTRNVAHTSVKEIIAASVNRFGIATQKVCNDLFNSAEANTNVIKSPGLLAVQEFEKMYAHHEVQAQMKQNFNVIDRGSTQSLSPVEQLKVLTLSTLVNTPLFVQDRQVVAREIDTLAAADTEQQVKDVSRRLKTEIETQQNKLVVQSLRIACETASQDAGFKTLESYHRGGVTRVIARDAKENVLVTEIMQDKKTKEIHIVTEPIGLQDNSCNRIIDNYNKSLEKSGVVYTSRNRKPTGGVCELAFTKEYQKTLSKQKVKNSSQQKRTRKLNLRKKKISINKR
jgi:hypothetical protein